MKLSVVVPMYNARNIVENLKDIVKSLKKFIDDFEIIVVNDGSSNNCYNDAKKFKDKHVKIVGYKKNSGKGNALKYGVRFAKGDHIAFLDEGGDLSASQLKNFLEILKDENGDIVIGSKRHSESNVRYPAIRRLMSRTYQTLNRILFNLKVKDTQVGIKLFKREVLERILPLILIKKFAFDLELLVVANKFKYKIIEAPISLEYKFESTINTSAVFWILIDTAAIFYRLKILRWYDGEA